MRHAVFFSTFLSFCVFLTPISHAQVKITCGTPQDEAAITHCALTSKSPEDKEQCWVDVIAGIDAQTQDTFDRPELMIRGLGPGTRAADDRPLETLQTVQSAFFDARDKICAIEGIKLKQFGACCQARMTRQMMQDFDANMRWP